MRLPAQVTRVDNATYLALLARERVVLFDDPFTPDELARVSANIGGRDFLIQSSHAAFPERASAGRPEILWARQCDDIRPDLCTPFCTEADA